MTRIALSLASVLFFFMAENIWLDPWLRTKSHRIPPLVPEALSGAWFSALAIGGIALTLLVVWQILLTRDPTLPYWTKIGTGTAVLVVLLLSVEWCRVTTGLPAVFRLQKLRKTHTVRLTWKASISQVAGYNVYRSKKPGGNYLRGTASGEPYALLNSSLVTTTQYQDLSVQSGQTYYYVVTAVGSNYAESTYSNEVSATIPTP
jgi:hypothetical protein